MNQIEQVTNSQTEQSHSRVNKIEELEEVNLLIESRETNVRVFILISNNWNQRAKYKSFDICTRHLD